MPPGRGDSAGRSPAAARQQGGERGGRRRRARLGPPAPAGQEPPLPRGGAGRRERWRCPVPAGRAPGRFPGGKRGRAGSTPDGAAPPRPLSPRPPAALPPAAFAHDRAAILRLTNYCTSFGAGGEPGTPDAAARSAHSHPPGASLPRGGCAGRPGSGGRCLSLPGRERGPSRSAAPPVRRRTPARGRPGPAEAAGGYLPRRRSASSRGPPAARRPPVGGGAGAKRLRQGGTGMTGREFPGGSGALAARSSAAKPRLRVEPPAEHPGGF